jgi:hypothetical protein
MRALIVVLLVASPAFAADKDEDKAKAVVGEFLKAVKDKDVDAVMKTVDVPFVLDFGTPNAMTIDKAGQLKEALSKLLEKADPDKVKGLEVGKVYDMAGFAKYVKDIAKDKPEEAEKFVAQAEKLVGKTGYMVMFAVSGKERPGLLIRVKDGKALIASLPK